MIVYAEMTGFSGRLIPECPNYNLDGPWKVWILPEREIMIAGQDPPRKGDHDCGIYNPDYGSIHTKILVNLVGGQMLLAL